MTLALSFSRLIPDVAIRLVMSALTFSTAAVTRGLILTFSYYISASSNRLRYSSFTLAFHYSMALRSGLNKRKSIMRDPIAVGAYL